MGRRRYVGFLSRTGSKTIMVNTYLMTRLLDTNVYIIYISNESMLYFGGVLDPSYSEFDAVDYSIEQVILE